MTKNCENINLQRNVLYHLFLLLIAVLFSVQSCYSFTGNTLDERIKTIQIKTFPNNAAYVLPTLSQDFSIAMQNRFLQRTTLKGTTENPHILIEGEITDYSISPTTISSPTASDTGGTVQAAQSKLTITVKVRYENAIEKEKSFERTYSDEAVFQSDLSQQEIESSQIKVVNERIINKIFNDIMNNW